MSGTFGIERVGVAPLGLGCAKPINQGLTPWLLNVVALGLLANAVPLVVMSERVPTGRHSIAGRREPPAEAVAHEFQPQRGDTSQTQCEY